MIAVFSLATGLALGRADRDGEGKQSRKVTAPLPAAQPSEDHWVALLAQLRWYDRRRVARVRTSISAFLAERGSNAFSIEHQSLAVSLETRVPQLVAECLRRCAGADKPERRRHLARALATLEAVASDADAARAEVRQADERHLEVLHRYFSDVSARRSREPDTL